MRKPAYRIMSTAIAIFGEVSEVVVIADHAKIAGILWFVEVTNCANIAAVSTLACVVI